MRWGGRRGEGKEVIIAERGSFFQEEKKRIRNKTVKLLGGGKGIKAPLLFHSIGKEKDREEVLYEGERRGLFKVRGGRDGGKKEQHLTSVKQKGKKRGNGNHTINCAKEKEGKDFPLETGKGKKKKRKEREPGRKESKSLISTGGGKGGEKPP